VSKPGLTRGELLKRAAATTPGLLLARSVPDALARTPSSLQGMNVLIVLSDQERAIQHFPPRWVERNLPGYSRLQRHGITFDNATCNACMCSPSRSTFMTGYLPAQHGVKYTLESDMSADQYPQIELETSFPNIATVMSAADYTPVYKGKFHCVKAAAGDENWVPEDVDQFGWTRWDPPDAGADQSSPQAGGGFADNDGRYVNAQGDAASGGEGVIEYLESTAAQQQPFCLVASLVNPHDVLFYPSNMVDGGYDDSWLQGYIERPPTADEKLFSKPSVQQQFLALTQVLGPLKSPQRQRNYVNFYGNVMRSTDAYLVKILQTLERTGLMDNTVIVRTADHGEMGMAHGGQRQKNFNMYEETLRVPLIYSNPRLWPRPQRSSALVSHVDLLPTFASLFGAPSSALPDTQGVDYSGVVLGRRNAVQDYTVFTYDDWQSGQKSPPYPDPPNHIVAIREQRWKFARYYDACGSVAPQYEMYDRAKDPYETKNLAAPNYKRTLAEQAQYQRLLRKLEQVEQTRLQPLPNTPESPITQCD
jgi:arylsulfatase A-like enzyme